MQLSVIARLKRLERGGGNDPCPCCADWARPLVLREPGFYGAERGQSAEPASCPICGRLPRVTLLRRDPDFFQNAARLSGLKEESESGHVDEAQAGK
jgi:hypothetical protein